MSSAVTSGKNFVVHLITKNAQLEEKKKSEAYEFKNIFQWLKEHLLQSINFIHNYKQKIIDNQFAMIVTKIFEHEQDLINQLPLILSKYISRHI
ncbi:unnamed protein product [Paramecium sonneborni]|uniref:Uncharacterized protein n=1 Tax=Paramecium sonneborni TaxID=65129 RepID=A0A8S1QHI3_9CILI|nr:unnamed protein product [Paramecium sonneborni]